MICRTVSAAATGGGGFKDAYKGGSGGVHIREVAFDDSSRSYRVQVSVPVVDVGENIGAVTIGVDMDQFEYGPVRIGIMVPAVQAHFDHVVLEGRRIR